MDDLDDGRELEHLGPVADAPAPRADGTVLAVVVLLATIVVLVGGERTSRPASPCRAVALSVRSWGVVGVEKRAPVVFAVVDVPPAARVVRLGVDGGQDTAPVVAGHAVVAVPLSTARLEGASAGRLSATALADVGAVAVVARDANGWSVARSPLGAGC